MASLRAVKGMNDVLPEEMPRWHRVEDTFRRLTERYGYGEVRTPIVEPTQLFVRSIGEVTDIVEKEMYTFTDKGEQSLTMRPEGTASAVRAYVQHTVYAREAVTKWIYLGPMYRRERPAKGRYRQFYQLGAEVYGDPGPYVDAEIIEMLVSFLRELGVKDVEVLVNSLGGPETRPAYRDALVAYLEPHRADLCPDCQRRLDKNPLRVVDCKVERDAAIARGAPPILDFLADEDRAHFDGLRQALDALDVPHTIDTRIVRGLDYYTRTLFEVKGSGGQLGAQDTLCGGGRYDQLVEELGGPSTPAIGFAIGIERLLMVMEEEAPPPAADVFVVAAGEALRTDAAVLARDLRAAGIRADADLRGTSVKSQMRRADKSGARVALILGAEEKARGVVTARDLANKTQHEVSRGDVVGHVRGSLVGNA